jgi:uncharacterized RDD family membrane protein YckC
VSQDTSYPGDRLGLPDGGPGSVATFGRRFVAVLIDWLLCQLIAFAVFGVEWGAGGWAAFVPLAIFAVENVLLVSTVGTTIGHRVMGLAVHRLRPAELSPLAGPPGFAAGAIRTVLLCLVLPALIPDNDNRGLHDKAARTVIVRSR